MNEIGNVAFILECSVLSYGDGSFYHDQDLTADWLDAPVVHIEPIMMDEVGMKTYSHAKAKQIFDLLGNVSMVRFWIHSRYAEGWVVTREEVAKLINSAFVINPDFTI